MSTRMLIDARHREETRVAVVRGTRIEDFDFEAANRKQLKGNIYLAKVTRVEPSLQAAFVEYGGNRHGFLAFSEIHPDYYQIPREDREAILQAEAAAHSDHHDDHLDAPSKDEGGEDHGDEHEIETNNHDDETEEDMRRRRTSVRRHYKIQEVIKRRQILLVQVVKEERGGKGAALTTYLSLAGRYCVLMPNTTHGGGISRKISSPTDRRRLKSIMADLKLPAGMGCIIRTAGLKRTKSEIKRDFDYLTRLWDTIREQTLSSVAPALVYEDSSLIKRAIRDIYSREIDEILVEGEEGYRNAKEFMRLLMPSHAKKVQAYRDPVPLFHRYQVESQLEGMYRPIVQLRSGGYLVINPTEALVSIDINSGRSTREHNIEETAYKTNLEAADEIARQLRLRDLAGLVVIDFIDMEDRANTRSVERRIKEAVKNDRARIQLGRISSFGLMEMSRQRLRTGVLEASTHVCHVCNGAGFVRTVSSSALHVIRALEEEAIKARASHFLLKLPTDVAFYLLNKKRAELTSLETRYGLTIEVEPKADLIAPAFELERSGPPPIPVASSFTPPPLTPEEEADNAIEDIEDVDSEEYGDEGNDEFKEKSAKLDRRQPGAERAERHLADDEDQPGRRRRRRRRRRRGGEGRDNVQGDDNTMPTQAMASQVPSEHTDEKDSDTGEGEAERRRRRRRRGRGRGRDRFASSTSDANTQQGEGATQSETALEVSAAPQSIAPETDVESKPRARRRSRALPKSDSTNTERAEPFLGQPAVESAPEGEAPKAEAKPKARRSRSKIAAAKPAKESAEVIEKPISEAVPSEAPKVTKAARPRKTGAAKAPKQVTVKKKIASNEEAAALKAQPPSAESVLSEATAPDAPPRPARKGWWQRTFG